MNRIDFTKPGGFPLNEDALAFMQSDYVRSLNGLASAWAASQGAQYVILSGCVNSGGVISAGICAINDEIIYCPGGSGNYVRIVETTQNATFANGSIHPVYITRMLVFQEGTGQIAWNEFVRIPKSATSAQGSKADSAVQSAIIGSTAVPKSGTELQLPAYPTSLPANGGNADTLGGILPSGFVTPAQLKADKNIGWTEIADDGNISARKSKYCCVNGILYMNLDIGMTGSQSLVYFLDNKYLPSVELIKTIPMIVVTQGTSVAFIHIYPTGYIGVNTPTGITNNVQIQDMLIYPIK